MFADKLIAATCEVNRINMKLGVGGKFGTQVRDHKATKRTAIINVLGDGAQLRKLLNSLYVFLKFNL